MNKQCGKTGNINVYFGISELFFTELKKGEYREKNEKKKPSALIYF